MSFQLQGDLRIIPSVGLVLSGLSDHSYSWSAETRQRLDTTRRVENGVTVVDSSYVNTKRLRQQDDTRLPINFGLSMQMSFFYRTAKGVSPGLSFGAVYNAGDQDNPFAFTIAPSLVLGGKDRLMLSLGLMVGQVRRLDARFNENLAYDATVYDAFNDNTKLTNQVWESSVFFGITYNIGKRAS